MEAYIALMIIFLVTPTIIVLMANERPSRIMRWLAAMLTKVWESTMILTGHRKIIEPPHHLDADPFEAKRMAIKNEHRWWGELFKQHAGHAWNYTPPLDDSIDIWDEDADETLLIEQCKNHADDETCYYCDDVEVVRNWAGQSIYQKRQRRKQ